MSRGKSKSGRSSKKSVVKAEEKKVEPAETQPEAALPAKQMERLLAEGTAHLDNDCAELIARRKVMSGDLLQYRYDIGLLATKIVEEKGLQPHERYYGSHTVHDVAERLEEADTTIYTCMKFIKSVTPAQLKEIKAKEWPWRAVQALIAVEDPKERKALQEGYEKGAFDSSDDFRQAAKKTNAAAKASGERKEQRGVHTHMSSIMQSLNTATDRLLAQTFADAADVLKTYAKDAQSMKASTADKLAGQIKEWKAKVPALEKNLARLKELIEKTGI